MAAKKKSKKTAKKTSKRKAVKTAWPKPVKRKTVKKAQPKRKAAWPKPVKKKAAKKAPLKRKKTKKALPKRKVAWPKPAKKKTVKKPAPRKPRGETKRQVREALEKELQRRREDREFMDKGIAEVKSRRRRGLPDIISPLEITLEDRYMLATPNEVQRVKTAEFYQQLVNEGKITRKESGIDIDSSRSAIMEVVVGVYDAIDEDTLDAIIEKVDEASGQIARWGHETIYASINIWQTAISGSPDGRSFSNPNFELFSKWDGVPAGSPYQVVNGIRKKLERLIENNEINTNTIVHEITIRSLKPEDIGPRR